MTWNYYLHCLWLIRSDYEYGAFDAKEFERKCLEATLAWTTWVITHKPRKDICHICGKDDDSDDTHDIDMRTYEKKGG